MLRPIQHRITSHWLMIVGLIALSARTAVADLTPNFMGLGDLPSGAYFSEANDISDDGTVVVGESYSASGLEAFRWELGSGMVGLSDLPGGSFFSFGFGISKDGAVAVGGSNSSLGREAYQWTSPGGMTPLSGGPIDTDAIAASGDGSVIVGRTGEQAFRWTSAEGVVGLGTLGVTIDNYAKDVSADGSVIVGQAESSLGLEAFRWTQVSGMVSLGDLPGGSYQSSAQGISSDGSTIVGYASSAASLSAHEAFRWTQADGMIGLGDLPGGGFNSIARAASGDGSTIVGLATNEDDVREVFIWNEAQGMRKLRDVLTLDYGLDVSDWTLENVTGISADGTTIVGSGYGPNGYEAWCAAIPEPSAISLLVVGIAMASIRRRTNGR